jgi:Domain of unknown function (DUF4118)
MSREDPIEVWLAIAGLGAVALGVLLIPLRTVTSASNLAFVFLAFTIVVAELGGRGPALLAALVSAMSLDFFLTQPYLTLAIDKTDDVIAFAGLAACALIAAAFGARRARWSETARRAAGELDVLKLVSRRLAAGESLDPVLEDLRGAFRLGAVVLRDAGDRVVAATPAGPAPGVPAARLAPDSLLASDATAHRFGSRGLRLPEGGGRLRLPADGTLAWLDLWEGDPQGLDLEERQTLSIAASILGLALAGDGRRLRSPS